MQRNNDFLGRDPIGRLLARLALPTIAAQLINMLYNIVDRIYIGHMPVADFLAVTFTALLFRSQFQKAIASMGPQNHA